MVLRKSFYIRWSAGRSPRVHEVNPGRDPSKAVGGADTEVLSNLVSHVAQLTKQLQRQQDVVNAI